MSHMAPTSHRLHTLAVAAALTALLCAGCAPRATPDAARETSAAPSPTSSATPEETVDFSFAGGGALAAHVGLVEWVDPFINDEQFPVLQADDGNGSWSFTDAANGCELRFFQGWISDVAAEPEDRAATDAVLLATGAQLNPDLTASDVEQYADSLLVPLSAADAEVATRVLVSTWADGASQAHLARRFTALKVDLFLSVACPAGDQHVTAELADLLDDQKLMIFAHPAG